MKIKRINIENFKGIKAFETDFEKNSIIAGANGTGKTSVFDAFLWLLFDKDSAGSKQFDLRPLDEKNNPIPKLVAKVEAVLLIENGNTIKLRKENHENYVKKQLRGYTNKYWVDDVPKKQSEYQDIMNEIILFRHSEDRFKLLTDPHYFNAKLHWTDRRKVLIDISGRIGTPQGFDDLLKEVGNRTLAEYKKMLAEQKKLLTEERDQIPPRIDEIRRGMPESGTTRANEMEFHDDLQLRRARLQEQIKRLDNAQKDLLNSEKERQRKIDVINQLKGLAVKREATLAADATGVRKHIEEQNAIQELLRIQAKKLTDARDALETQIRETNRLDADMKEVLRRLNVVRMEYEKAAAIPEAKAMEMDDAEKRCPTCGQSLPADRIQKIVDDHNNDRKRRLDEITQRGSKIKEEQKIFKQKIDAAQAAEEAAKAAVEELIAFNQAEYDKHMPRFQELENAITNRTKPDPKKDAIWLQLQEDITKAKAEIGDPVADQIEAIGATRFDLEGQIRQVSDILAQGDRNEKDQARIKVLEKREQEITQQLADIDQTTDAIDAYNEAHSRMIETAVNGKFKHVTFKLFNTLLNGTIEETCQSMYHGVPYESASYGQKMVMGVDIINVLASHYKVTCPLFIDNAESLTYTIDTPAQTIMLKADPNEKKVRTL